MAYRHVNVHASEEHASPQEHLDDVATTIYETCKAYLLKQGQLLMVLELSIGACIVYYFASSSIFAAGG